MRKWLVNQICPIDANMEDELTFRTEEGWSLFTIVTAHDKANLLFVWYRDEGGDGSSRP